MKKKLGIFLGIEVLILFSLNILNVKFFKVGNIVQFPYIQISKSLRYLSLSGTFGNVLSWLLFIGVSILPFIYFLILCKRKVEKEEDYFLILISILLFSTIYLGINSKIIVFGQGNLLDLSYYMSLLTTQIIFLYIVFKFLKADLSNKNSTKVIVSILFLTSVISVFNVFGPKLNKVSNGVDNGIIYTENYEIYNESHDFEEEFETTVVNYELIGNILDFVNDNVLDIVYIVLSMGIIGILIDIEKNGEEDNIIKRLYSLKKLIKILFISAVLISILINFIFVFYSSYFDNISLKPLLNFNIVVFIVIVNYIVNYLIKVKEIKEENEQFV